MKGGRLVKWFIILVLGSVFVKIQGAFIDITYLESAVEKGAVCLDGSAPAYHFDKGSGTGINNWIVHVEGGGWCSTVASCNGRKSTNLGSSKLMSTRAWFAGILSNQQTDNPDFYNWNRVKIRYCDGSSFTGDREAVDPATNLHFRGARIFTAVIEDLLAKGMKSAENALLSGCSAGGLTSIIHCDNFKNLLPATTKVKCISDAGFFVNVKDISGAPHIEDYYKDVVNTHGSEKNLPASCTSKSSPHLCFFPQNTANQIQTPLFILNAAYDSWQIENILVPKATADPSGSWETCKINLTACSPTQLQTLQGFRREYIKALDGLGKSATRGLFINSCYTHCQSEMQETWLTPNSPSLNGVKIGNAVGDWFYDRKPFQNIDCPFPCDKTCHTDHVGIIKNDNFFPFLSVRSASMIRRR